jgi:gas vesicle protein
MNTSQELEYSSNIPGIMIGLVIGSLAGAFTMLLLAPQSGKRTRALIQKRGLVLVDSATKLVDDTVSEVNTRRKRLLVGGRKQAKKIIKQGQEAVAEQLDHVSKAAEAGKKAVKSL